MRAREAGFTLLELLAVLALLGIAAAVVWPAPPPAGATALRAAASTMAATLIEARETAQREGEVRCVALDGSAEGCRPVADVAGVARTVSGPGIVRFHGDGSGSAVLVRLAAGGLSREVRVVGATGQVVLR